MATEQQATGARDTPVFTEFNHVGLTVANIERAIDFWTHFFDAEAPEVRVVDADFVPKLQGYPGRTISLKVAMMSIPGPTLLELVEWSEGSDAPLPIGTAHAGTAHLCFGVHDLWEGVEKAVNAGAVKVSTEPLLIESGPAKGSEYMYLRGPDGVTIELRKPPS